MFREAPDGRVVVRLERSDGLVLHESRVGILHGGSFRNFVASVPPNEAAHQLLVMLDGVTLWSVLGSEHLPVVQSIRGDADPVQEVLRIKWAAVDADNDALRSEVHLSLNAGHSFVTVGRGGANGILEVPLENIQETCSALARVRVFDGFHMTVGVSESFMTPRR